MSSGHQHARVSPGHAARADQIALPLDWPQSQGESRLIVSDSNRDAFEHFRKWSLWPVKATLLTGPRRSGRSLLARNFVERVGGRVVDNADRSDEEELFHAWNAAQESGRPLVMVVDRVLPDWEIALPDLRTRIAVTPVARIDEPEVALQEGQARQRLLDARLGDERGPLRQTIEVTHLSPHPIGRGLDVHGPKVRKLLPDGCIESLDDSLARVKSPEIGRREPFLPQQVVYE